VKDDDCAPDPCAPNPCEPSPANIAPCEPYACSIAAIAQFGVDLGRQMVASMGFRPYEVWLVWQVRAKNGLGARTWREDHRIRLFPVRVPGLDEVAIVLGENGQYKEGGITLTEISPQQVDESTLRGYRNGVAWAQADNDREFFYEIFHSKRCPGDPEPQRHRFTVGSPPYHDAQNFQWRITVVPQIIDRSGTGQDQALVPPKPNKRPVVTT
jgi:hypothetical protein